MFTTGTKVVWRYQGGWAQQREVGHVFKDGSFRLVGGMHRYHPVEGKSLALRRDDDKATVEIAQ